jgi:hypothetical protein
MRRNGSHRSQALRVLRGVNDREDRSAHGPSRYFAATQQFSRFFIELALWPDVGGENGSKQTSDAAP